MVDAHIIAYYIPLTTKLLVSFIIPDAADAKLTPVERLDSGAKNGGGEGSPRYPAGK